MRVNQVGEFGLIDRLAQIVPSAPNQIIAGIGDDAAAWLWGKKTALATTDTMVENVHFKGYFGSWYDLGWKCIAVNLSDIAGMGGIADYALVTIGVPGDTEIENIAEMYRGMADISKQFGTAIIGGDTVSSPSAILLSATVFGEAIDDDKPPKLLLRSNASVGDQVCVTGFLGSSAGGLQLLLQEKQAFSDAENVLRQAHLRPTPRLKEGQELVKAGVRAGMDISDGLVGDLQKICQQSNVGARIWTEKLPIHQALRDTFPTRCVDLALYGGEDYELLFCAPKKTIAAAAEALQARGLAPIAIVGEIVAEHVGEVTLVTPDGTELKALKTGYDHFIHATSE